MKTLFWFAVIVGIFLFAALRIMSVAGLPR